MNRNLKSISGKKAKELMEKYDSKKGYTGGLTDMEIFQLGKQKMSNLYELSDSLAEYYMQEVSDMFEDEDKGW